MSRLALRARLRAISKLQFALVIFALGTAPDAYGGDQAPARPLQTELLAPLDMSHVKEGTPVLARVDLDWTGDGCRLQSGSIVQGHVVRVERRTKTQHTSAIQITFTGADCNGRMGAPYSFTLVALVGPSGSQNQTGQSGATEAPPLADAPVAINGGTRSVTAASSLNQFALQPVRSLPSQIVPGQVVDISHVNLSVGTGEGGATVISGVKRDVRLERATSLILLPTSSRRVLAGSGAGAADGKPQASRGVVLSSTGGQMSARPDGTTVTEAPAAPALLPPPEPADQTEICSGVCNVVGSMTSRGSAASVKEASLPIHSLGYSPHEKRPSASFSDETTLTYLDGHNLLCTFDPHALRPRADEESDGARTVRAVLIDPATRSVKRVVEWHVRGNSQYLWRLASGRVLVHMGHELRLFDAELKPVRAVRVEGPVAYVITQSPLRKICQTKTSKRLTSS